jgi:Cu/Ag efflux pump CusA
LQVSSNIMSLGGLALAIRVLVDASIVMVEDGYRHPSERQAVAGREGSALSEEERRGVLLAAARQVGRPFFFSMVIIVVSFLPVFLLEAQEGRFRLRGADAAVPCLYALTGGLVLQYLMVFNFSVAVWVGYIALFGIEVETGVVTVIYLDEALERHLATQTLSRAVIEAAAIEGSVQRLRPKLMTVAVVILSLAPVVWSSGIGSDVMKPIAAPIVGGMVTLTIHVLIRVPVFFAMMQERRLRRAGRIVKD